MDIKSLAVKVKNLEEWERALQAEGRISDPDRRTLVDYLMSGKLQGDDKEQALAMTMGSLGGMQDLTRCYEWWEVVSRSPESIRAAQQKGLPFTQEVLGSDARWEFLEREMEANRPECAWLLWSHACRDQDRQSLLPTLVDYMGRKLYPDIEHNEAWMQSLSETGNVFPLSLKFEYLGKMLADRMNYLNPSEPGNDNAELARLIPIFFPEGVSAEQAHGIRNGLLGNGTTHNAPARQEDLALILAPWIALHSSTALDRATPLRPLPVGSRRI